MRTILTLGALALFVTVVVAGGRTMPHAKVASKSVVQSATAIMMYDEYGNPVVYGDNLPTPYPDGSYDVYDEPSDYYYYGYAPTSYNYGYGQTYGGNSSYSSGNVSYDAWGNAYSPSAQGYGGTQYNNYTYYTPPPQPWYVQAFPGVGNIAQPIVQGIAPQTVSYARPSCSVSASPSTIPYGGSTVVRWTSQGSDWSDLTGLGTVDPSGLWQFDGMTRSQTFVLNLSGNGGTGSCSTAVTVRPR
jgi:hypothetical protein